MKEQPVVHEVDYYRFQRGMTPIRPSRPVYGYKLRCTCGWSMKVNGTKPEAMRFAKEHVKGAKETP